MTNPLDDGSNNDLWNGCSNVPELDRLHYYYGQMLGPRDFQTEQDFFRNKMKLLNRSLHGYGVVCGLKVEAVNHNEEAPEKKTPEAGYGRPGHLHIRIGSGMALDPAGNELVVRENSACSRIDVWALLCEQEDEKKCATLSKDDGLTLYVSLCYFEHKRDPQRVSDACADSCSNYQTYARLRDCVCVKVSLTPPAGDDRCGPCCEPYTEQCVLLARIDHAFSPHCPPEIHNEVRRPVGLYEPTTIIGINWQHGATYEDRAAETFLRRRGLTMRFSRPVVSGTIKPGVIDVWRTDDWQSPNKSGEFACLPVVIQPIKGDTTSEVTFKIKENLGSDDRVLIIVRTDFILDTCCRPVDGNHVGGMVPLIPVGTPPEPRNTDGVPAPGDNCQQSHRPFRRRESGNGIPGGTFESWFFTIGESDSDADHNVESL